MTRRNLISKAPRQFAGLALAGLFSLQAAHAYSGKQTDQAFAALLSMPGAGPEQGRWDFPPAEDFEATSESALIAFLAKKHKAGADLNAYRHLGTLLHHAIRAGKVGAAQWLLANGADPRKKVLDGGQDAMGLASTYKHSELVRLLHARYGLARPAPWPPQAPPQPPPIANAPQDQLRSMMTSAGREVKNGQATSTYRAPPEAWRTFWRKQLKPLDYRSDIGWAAMIQPELWPELFASGYQDRQAETALGCLLNDISAAEFKQIWPRLESHFADIRQVAPRMILRAYRLAPLRYTCAANPDEATTKLLFLTQLGIKVPVDALLARKLASAPAALLAAMKPFTQVTFPKRGNTEPRLVQVKPVCNPNLTAELARELATVAVVGQGAEKWSRVHIESVQWVDLPGQSDCALLVGGFSQVDPYVDGVQDTFTGPEGNPRASCPDPTDRYEVWNPRGQRIQRLSTDMGQDRGDAPLIPVIDQLTGKRYALHTGVQHGGCHASGRPPFLLGWQTSASGLALNRVESADLENALYWQCPAPEGEYAQCNGIPSTLPKPEAQAQPPAASDAHASMDLDSFLKTLLADRLERYQAAVLALDIAALRVLQREGIPARWTSQAIEHLGKTSLSLAEKRRRIAWLFVDRTQLHRSLLGSYSAAESLIDWLPLQDWRPVWDVLAQDRRGGYALSSLRRTAEEKGFSNLACAIDNAQGFLCGETIGASE